MAELTYNELLTELAVIQAFMDKVHNFDINEYKELEEEYNNLLELIDKSREN